MDPQLLGNLMDRFAPSLELYARQWCDATEDVVQEAFVKLASQNRPPQNPPAWLFRTVRNGAINAGVARRRRVRHEQAASVPAGSWFEANESTAIDPAEAEAALSALPASQREVIVAHVWGGLTFEQVAEVIEVSASSAHRLYQAGLMALRARLGVACRTNTARRTMS